MFSTGRLVKKFGTQRFKSPRFVLWLQQAGRPKYLADSTLDNDVEGHNMSS